MIAPTPFNRIKNVLSASLNTIFTSFLSDDRGCYTKTPGMNALAVDYFTMTLTLCKQLCLGQRKQLALVHPSSCFCADEAEMNDMTPANDVTSCDTPCLGNPTQFCGGENALRAYELGIWKNTEFCFEKGTHIIYGYLIQPSVSVY